MSVTIDEIFEYYEKGYFTYGETVNRLIDASVHTSPEDYISKVPEDMIEKMKEITKTPPATIDSQFYLEGGTYKADASQDEIQLWQDLRKTVGFAALWRMHVYFHQV